jgi:hypothetical protein
MGPADWRARHAQRKRERDAAFGILHAMGTLAEREVPESTCTKCRLPVKLIGGIWTDPDGTINCPADLSTAYTPHEPEVPASRREGA